MSNAAVLGKIALVDDADMAQKTPPPLKVSELVSLLKADIEQKHRFVRVVGEVSSLKLWRSGHAYFDIKDEIALIPAVMFRPHYEKLAFKVADGQHVLFSGYVSVYKASAKLQMIVEAMEPLGQGALLLAFEQLKERLSKEGLFDARHKKPIKRFNQCVGIVTSSHGAVLKDIVRILKARMPKVDILFVATRVQGEGAALEIKMAIELLDYTGACDVIIVGRGGGSLEDLWAFNEEVVARAIFLCKTPIISAVGHETDVTVSDFVADMRAATPTHAATLAVLNFSEFSLELETLRKTFILHLDAHLSRANFMVSQEKRRLRDPRMVLFRHWQQVDELKKRLDDQHNRRLKDARLTLSVRAKKLAQEAPLRKLRERRDALYLALMRLLKKSPEKILVASKTLLGEKKQTLHRSMSDRLKLGRKSLEHLAIKLDACSPHKVLFMGYSLVENAEGGQILKKRAHFSRGQHIKIRVVDGEVFAKVLE